MKYRCDRCSMEHHLDENKVKNKQYYISPSSCYAGDYYVDAYFWFECNCGRAIQVRREDLSNPFQIEKEYSEHRGVCPIDKFLNI